MKSSKDISTANRTIVDAQGFGAKGRFGDFLRGS